MKMRFRTGGSHYAELKALGFRFAESAEDKGDKVYGWYFSDAERAEAKAAWDATPAAEPGDVWRVRWGGDFQEDGTPWPKEREHPIAGYAICCPGCRHVHAWTTAGNCNQKIERSYVDAKTGETHTYQSCVHSGVGSCWDWSGSAEEGTLTASPSLLVTAEDCHWHGWLRAGELTAC